MTDMTTLEAPRPVVCIDFRKYNGGKGMIVDVSTCSSGQREVLKIIIDDKLVEYDNTKYRSILFEHGAGARIHIRTKVIKVSLHNMASTKLFINDLTLYAVQIYDCEKLNIVSTKERDTDGPGRYHIEKCAGANFSDSGSSEFVVYGSSDIKVNSKVVIGRLSQSCVIRSTSIRGDVSSVPIAFPRMGVAPVYLPQTPTDTIEDMRTGQNFSW
jgi:hypothetical protein